MKIRKYGKFPFWIICWIRRKHVLDETKQEFTEFKLPANLSEAEAVAKEERCWKNMLGSAYQVKAEEYEGKWGFWAPITRCRICNKDFFQKPGAPLNKYRKWK